MHVEGKTPPGDPAAGRAGGVRGDRWGVRGQRGFGRYAHQGCGRRMAGCRFDAGGAGHRRVCDLDVHLPGAGRLCGVAAGSQRPAVPHPAHFAAAGCRLGDPQRPVACGGAARLAGDQRPGDTGVASGADPDLHAVGPGTRRRPDRALDHVADLRPVPGVGERRDGCEHRGVAGLARCGQRCRLGATAGCGVGRHRRAHWRRHGAVFARADVGGLGHGVGHCLDRRGSQRRRDVFDDCRRDCIYRRGCPAGVHARLPGWRSLPAGSRCSEVRP